MEAKAAPETDSQRKYPYPDWIDAGLEEIFYELHIVKKHVSVEFIELTRTEYVQLKFYLAELRGHKVPGGNYIDMVLHG